jgi:hypothetical protein
MRPIGLHLVFLLLMAPAVLTAMGCRTVHAADPAPGVYEPLFERHQIQDNLRKAHKEAGQNEGVARDLALAAADLWQSLDALIQQLPLPEELGRAREADAVTEYLRRVGRAARTAPSEQPLVFPAPVVQLSAQDFVDTAHEAAAAGRYDEALVAAESLLDRLEPTSAAAPLAVELRYETGLWLLAQGRYDEAREAFSMVTGAPSRMAQVGDRARLMAEEIDLLLMLPETPARDGLARGWALLESGARIEAATIARQVSGAAPDAETAREAQALADAVARVEAQDAAEAAARTAAEAAEAVETTEAYEAQWAAAMSESHALLTAERFREAAAVFDDFVGTELEERAAEQAAAATEILVREDRKRAGELFVAAQRSTDPAERRTLLESARSILRSLLDDFPTSGYADRVQRNLDAVERSLAELAPPAPTP